MKPKPLTPLSYRLLLPRSGCYTLLRTPPFECKRVANRLPVRILTERLRPFYCQMRRGSVAVSDVRGCNTEGSSTVSDAVRVEYFLVVVYWKHPEGGTHTALLRAHHPCMRRMYREVGRFRARDCIASRTPCLRVCLWRRAYSCRQCCGGSPVAENFG